MQPSNDSAACLGAVASAAPVPISLYFSVNVIALPVLPDSLSLQVFHFLSFLCVCRACTSLPGAVEGLPPTLLRDGRGRCCIKEGHLSGVRARTNNNPRPLSFCREFRAYTHCLFPSPLFFFSSSCFYAEVDASNCCA